jgi:amino acid adenylation domain-containing protein
MRNDIALRKARLSAERAKLSPAKQALLEQRLQGQALESPAQAIQRISREGPLELSFAQQRLWFLDQLEPGSPFYNIPLAIRLSGQLDVTALQRSLDEIVRRHETLRTTFVTESGQPLQVIAPPSPLPLLEVDLGELPEEEREAQARELARQEAQRPFDLARGPLVRVCLLRLAPARPAQGGPQAKQGRRDEHVLLLTLHHIISDGWSMGVLVRELVTLYRAFSAGDPSPLPDLPIQYADFAIWQRQWLFPPEDASTLGDQRHSQALETQLAYWKQQLGGKLPVLELPTDRPRPPTQTFRGAHHRFTLPPALSTALKTHSQQNEVTLFMTLLAAFQVLLHRHTGQTDIAVGSPIANRNREEIEGLIGFFVNTLVLRTDLSGNPSFRDLLRRVRQVTLEAYAHQDLPFDKLVEALQPERDLSRTPLFQVMFALQNAPMERFELPELSLSLMRAESATSRFDLMLSLAEIPNGLVGEVEYNTDLFDASTITRLVEHFQILLEGIVAELDRRLSDLPLLTPAEEHQLLLEWNDTRIEYPRDKCIHELFQAQVAQTPDAVAVVFEEHHLTYQALNERANQLAHHLQALGVRPETLVGVCLERSVEMVVGLLGIFKAGGAYVPLDPAYPRDRLAFMLQDSLVPVLLTQERLRADLPIQSVKHLICLDTGWAALAQENDHNPTSEATPHNVAYMIYTSGSTGRPRGVVVQHRSVINLWTGLRQALYTLRPGACRVSLNGPLSFDTSVKQLVQLLGGHSLHILSEETRLDAHGLLRFLRDQALDVLDCTPSQLQLLIQAGLWDIELAQPMRVLVGGESIDPDLWQDLAQAAQMDFFNVYGPTECTVDATVGPVLGSIQPALGRPIANTHIYVLDERLNLAPVGVPGELCIGGDSLARGYLNQPGLTAERFIPNPFTLSGSSSSAMKEPGSRLYKTGDLARYRPDGNIEFLGRLDYQVKIRGFRIELGEIEAALSQHPQVRQVVVIARDVARQDQPGDKRPSHEDFRLVAYIVPDSKQAPSADELRRILRSQLPEYMLPSAFVFLQALPLTPNGKVDRRALPAPDSLRPELETPFAPPRNPTEEMLVSIWSQVLGIEQLGIHDNFFELGGHSLLATQVVSRLRQAFQVELPLHKLFEKPTVAGLGECIQAARREQLGLIAPPVAAVSLDRAALSFAQQRLWFFDQLEPGSSFYNISTAVRLDGVLDAAVLERSFNEVVRRHQVLRTTFASAEGQPVQVVAPSMTIPLWMIDLGELPEEEGEAQARELARQEAQRPFDLARGPLVRVCLLRLADACPEQGRRDDHVLLLTLHHIISDGWSMGVLVRELVTLYRAFSAGDPSPLPDLPIQYADFAVWQRQWLFPPEDASTLGDQRHSQALETQLAYWKRQLGGKLPVLELPTDRPRPPTQTFRGAHHRFTLPPALSMALKTHSQQNEVTLFMTLLAAFQVLLHRHTGQTDIAVGSPIANRNREEIEGLIGFFVNTLVLRTDLSGNPSFRDLLRRVRQVTLEAYAHQDLPFDKLVEALQPERDLSRTPLFQVMFALQNAPMEPFELPELHLGLMDVDSATSKFDLTLSLAETPLGLSGEVEYNTDLFDAGTITRLVEHFQILLEGIVANLDQRLSDLPLLTQSEQHQLLLEWNDTQADYSTDQCLPMLFQAQVEQRPDAVALVHQGQHLTYQELDRRANQVAHHLRMSGVRPETLVGVCLERSVEMVVGLLGILKAGGAYLPLDPAYPRDRLAFMIADSLAWGILTQRRWAESLGEHLARVVCLDTDWDAIAQAHADDLPCQVAEENLAYVIYTSGSTGQPKGVQVEHGGLSNLVFWHQRAFALSPDDRATHLAGLSFDASVWELWPYLAMGATVCLLDDETRTSPAQLQEWLLDNAITISFLPTPLAESILLQPWPNGLALRTLLTGGDRLRVHPSPTLPFELVNNYGPTENTVVATSVTVPSAEQAQGTPSIGCPIANVQVYLLDEHLQPVPIGTPGELYIGGDSLARGYLNQPGLTAERFIPNPFTLSGFSPSAMEGPGSRLYKTGDLARYRPDGNIEFLGRLDYQVKIRGFRIELGEIEAVLKQHTKIQEAIVVAHDMVRDAERGYGDKQLVGYVVPQEGQVLEANDLRRFLQDRLPDYMVPASFVTLESLPLTPNGKVDRRALPAPDSLRPELETPFAPPRNPTEEMLVSIWSQVLGIERLGIHDNFFELGGHSLLATQVVSRLRQAFQIELPLHKLFEKPTVAELGECIRAARQEQLGLVAPPVAAVSLDRAALSFAQLRLWFLDQLEPGSPFYNIPLAIRLSGQLDVTALQHSLDEIVRRHETLRTTFVTEGEQPLQVIAPPSPLPLLEVDLGELPEEERGAQARELARQEAQRPFDLARGPLVRVCLLRLADACPAQGGPATGGGGQAKQGRRDEHVLLLTLHHIISDGWSMGVLVRELVTLYRAFSAGSPSPLPDLPIQYADFAVWQRAWLQGKVLEKQINYWKQQLGGRLPALELPMDRPRPPIQTFHGAQRSFTLPVDLLTALQVLSQQNEVTLFMTLLAAFQVLLHRYTGQTDIAVGSPIANRSQVETESLIGFFVNTLVLRTDLSGNPGFRELLGRVREVTLDAYTHQDVPFEKLVEVLQPERDLSRTPLFQVMFALQNAPMEAFELPGLSLSPMEVDSSTSKFDLTLSLNEASRGLVCVVEYNTDLFEADTIGRLISHFQTLLEGIAADPIRRIADLPLLTEAEQHQLLVEWNDTWIDYPRDGYAQSANLCIHELFEAQVAQFPDALAVVFEEQHLTYQALNGRADQLAHHLQALGVGPETLVGICMERSAEMVIGLLGTLKAGGAYVPLDPTYPPDRLAFMMADAQTPVLLVQARLVPILPEHTARVVCLDADWKTIAQQDTQPPVSQVMDDNLAYVIYTSGSTGKPKGAMNTHGAIRNRLLWMQAAYCLTGVDRVMQKTPFSFDVSVWEFFWPLLTGACLVVARPEGHKDSAYLVRTVVEQDISTLHFVPSMLQAFVEDQGIEACHSLKRVICSGEALPFDLQERFFKQLGAELHNLYGPTETAVDVTYWQCQSRNERPVVPIGFPIANTQIYLLDVNLRPVPVGVPGELHIGGVGLARGYHHRSDLTAAKFIPNPFPALLPSTAGGTRLSATADARHMSRLYKTGDLARYLPDGSIEYLGRIDHQIKLRGFRIELGEIEAVLKQHGQVQEAVVVAHDMARQVGDKRSIPKDLRLVAYLVPNLAQTPSTDELRSFLQNKLPEYMLPSAFVFLDALPLTPNGKIDRRALPAPEQTGSDLAEILVPPRDVLELGLVQIWQDLLGVQPIGIRHNFFELGGHSLLAVRLVSRIRQQWGQSLPLATLFQNPTIEHLANVMRRRAKPLTSSALVTLQKGDARKRPLFLVHAAGGGMMCYADLVRHLGASQPCYGLQARGLDGDQEPDTQIEVMARSYIELLRTAQPQGPYLLGGWSLGGVIAFEMAQQLTAQGQAVALLVLIDSYAPTGKPEAEDELTLLARFGRDLGVSWQTVPYDLDYLKQLDLDERLAYLLEQAQRARVMPPDIELAQIRRLFHVYQSNVTAIRQYVASPYSGAITLFKAQEAQTEAGMDLGWGKLAVTGVTVQQIPGDHYSAMREPNVKAWAGQLWSLVQIT